MARGGRGGDNSGGGLRWNGLAQRPRPVHHREVVPLRPELQPLRRRNRELDRRPIDVGTKHVEPFGLEGSTGREHVEVSMRTRSRAASSVACRAFTRTDVTDKTRSTIASARWRVVVWGQPTRVCQGGRWSLQALF